MSKYICVFCNERKHAETAYKLCGNIGICRVCHDGLDKTAPSLPYPGTKDISYIMSPFEYTKNIRQAILDFKFHNCRSYAPLFAVLMEEYLNSYNVWDRFDYIIPVPLHKKRMKERGYNQAELIARHISEYLAIPMCTDILERTRATKRQSSMQKFDRALNVQDAFACNKNITDKSILLFDDICTTGSTLQSCASALTSAGAQYVCALTLAIHVVQKLPIITY